MASRINRASKIGRIIFSLTTFLIAQGASAGPQLFISAAPMYVQYSNSGDQRNALKLSDQGLWAAGQIPLSATLFVSGAAAFGLSSDFSFLGAGFTYYFFNPSSMESQAGDSIHVTTFRKYNPSLEVLAGVNNTQTQVIVNRVGQKVTEQYIGGLIRAKVDYALNTRWWIESSLMSGFSGGNGANVTFYGLTVGAKIGF